MGIRLKKIFLSVVFSGPISFLPSFVFAQNTSYQLLAPLPEFGSTYTPNNFGSYVQQFIYLAIIVAAILAVANIVWGGFRYMTNEAMDTKQAGKNQIQRSILGLLILTASFLILNTINPYILNFRLDIQPLNGAPANQPRNISTQSIENSQSELNGGGAGILTP